MSGLQPNIEIDLCTLLFGGCAADGRPLGHPLLARRHLSRLGLSRSAADFLALAIWWWVRAGRREFYKFNAPCDHPDCREADTWREELGVSWRTLRQARATVATRIRRGDSKKAVLESHQLTSLLLYWHRPDNRTYYELNEPLLCSLLSQALEVRVVMSAPHTSAPKPRHKQPPNQGRGGAAAILDDPHPCNSYTPSVQSYPQGGQTIGNSSRGPSDTDCDRGDNLFSSIQHKEEEVKYSSKDAEFIRLTALALENEGVFPQPALEIATRAYNVGLDLDATLELFWAHTAHAASSVRIKDPLAAATRRLQRGSLKMPKAAKESRAQARFLRAIRGEEDTEGVEHADYDRDGAWQGGKLATTSHGESASLPEPVNTAEALPEKGPEEQLWRMVLGDLALQMTTATFNKWLLGSHLERAEQGEYLVRTRDAYGAEWLANRLARQVTRTLERHIGSSVTVGFAVYESSVP